MCYIVLDRRAPSRVAALKQLWQTLTSFGLIAIINLNFYLLRHSATYVNNKS